jgi:hypothetical protein
MRFATARKPYSDESLIIAAWVMLFSSTILLHTQTPALYEQYAVVVGEVPWDIGFVKRHRTFLRSIAPFGLLFYTCLWTVKLSLLLFFGRVVGLQAWAHKTWWYCYLPDLDGLYCGQ